ncbi:MAG: cysteine dioxygenase family protein [Pseudoxanthomonas sp.]
MSFEFDGKQGLVEALDAAVSLGNEARVVHALQDCLARLAAPGGLVLPEGLRQPLADHYARREIHRSDTLGYSVVVMTWSPGQGTPIHDHDTLWCVEGVWQGLLEVTDYDVTAQVGGRFRFCDGHLQPGPTGSTSALLPPAEFHTVRNPDPSQAAVSMHVYQRPLTHFGVYELEAQDSPWYLRHDRSIGTDA